MSDYILFTETLLEWYKENGRILPWRETHDPYRIMVSEFMLQQTQVTRVIEKYNLFLSQFPTIQDLAKADLGDVLKIWVGLGYNRRAKFLHKAGQYIVNELNGEFPRDREHLLKIPGIGPYTTGAILAFAYNKPEVVIDANVKNVFNRVFGLSEKEIEVAVGECVPKEHAREFYNALMDIGSTFMQRGSSLDEYPFLDICKWANGHEIPSIKKYKQSKFEGSNRWYRGQIVKTLTSLGPVAVSHFEGLDNSEMYAAALEQLTKEKMVLREKQMVYLA